MTSSPPSTSSSSSSKPTDATHKGLGNSDSYNAEEFDLSYRAGLEVLRMGELEVNLPEIVPLCYESLPPLPAAFRNKTPLDPKHIQTKYKVHTQLQLQTQREVSMRYEKLYKVASVLKKQSYLNESPNLYPRLLCVRIFYSLPTGSRQGLVFRQNVKSSMSTAVNAATVNATNASAGELKSNGYACVYTVSKGAIGMRDPHGV